MSSTESAHGRMGAGSYRTWSRRSVLALPSATLGVLCAARTLGPLDRRTPESAIDTIGRMAASFETE